MKITTNKFGMADVVRYQGAYCQVIDIIAKKGDPKWYYDLHECFGDGEHLDVPEGKLRDLTERQRMEFFKRA